MAGAPDRDRSAARREGWPPDDRVLELAREGRVEGATADVVLRTACEYEFTRLLE